MKYAQFNTKVITPDHPQFNKTKADLMTALDFFKKDNSEWG
jgi:hypothetical protein